MRQVSITQMHDGSTSVWIDGATTRVVSHAAIGKALAQAGIHPDQRVNVMDTRGRTDRIMAAQFLPPPPTKKGSPK